jgi:hypothetical protein
VGGAGGQASGHQGIVVKLEDGAAAPDEDLRRPTMRSPLAVAKPDDARCWLAAATYGGRRGERRRLKHMVGVRKLTTWMRRSATSDSMETIGSARTGPVGTVGPLKALNFAEFGRCVASMCPTPSDRRTWCQPQHH